MRVDHLAYQRATRVAQFGFAVQLTIGLTLLIFGLRPGDTTILFGAGFVLLGLLAWTGLIVLFNQHKLERLEALEHDELLASRSSAESVFAAADDEQRVAARRLSLIHRWLMPILSLLLAGLLVLIAYLDVRFLGQVDRTEAEFVRTDHLGWAVAICLSFAAIAFIVSRFVAGMSKQPAWQNLRGGAGYMVANALVTLALAVGIGFRFFNNEAVNEKMAWAIPIFMCVFAAEIVLNFVLNLYRPRVADEVPRPAFDSRLMSLFAAPDNLVRSINEAVNYQFGFDVASSWGYKLLMRSFAWLLGLGVAALLFLSCIVIVEPSEQAVKLSRGAIVDDEVHGSGLMWKLPWPFQTAEVVDVSHVRELHLTNRQVRPAEVQLWMDDLGQKFDKKLDPFIVGAAALPPDVAELLRRDSSTDVRRILDGADVDPEADVAVDDAEEQQQDEEVAEAFSLVDAEMILHYRIREDGDGLLDYLGFGTDEFVRQERLTVRELALRAIARQAVTQAMSKLTLDEILGPKRADLSDQLAARVQEVFDRSSTGLDVVAMSIPLLRPAGEAAGQWEEVALSQEARREYVAAAELDVVRNFVALVGDTKESAKILATDERLQALRRERGDDDPEVREQQRAVEQMIRRSPGQVAGLVRQAQADALQREMNARAQAAQVEGQAAAYAAAPNLYRERAIMQVYQQRLPRIYKYLIGIDPSRIRLEVDLTEINPLFDIGAALPDTQESGQ